ncbi:hypothetical protein GGX14DRAFT_545762 [Mycena pura]|uniref:Uncharacterized protein n=1 Tax=Mycena pura TaxID=153505 RepID=A0AAD6Y170_9AGAR|nr:hypothetical protein GGX14DRAFT_545762 [Mycena pura]
MSRENDPMAKVAQWRTGVAFYKFQGDLVNPCQRFNMRLPRSAERAVAELETNRSCHSSDHETSARGAQHSTTSGRAEGASLATPSFEEYCCQWGAQPASKTEETMSVSRRYKNYLLELEHAALRVHVEPTIATALPQAAAELRVARSCCEYAWEGSTPVLDLSGHLSRGEQKKTSNQHVHRLILYVGKADRARLGMDMRLVDNLNGVDMPVKASSDQVVT